MKEFRFGELRTYEWNVLGRQKCSWTKSICSGSETVAETKYIGTVKLLLCPNCKIGIGVCINGTWKSLEDVLTDNSKDGWIKVSDPQDQRVHLVLSQIIYREHEVPNENCQEAVFDFPDPADVIMLRWFKGTAIGFYTVKPKGTLIAETRECYVMNMLDTAYIRRQYRRKGFGIEILHSLSNCYPDQDIGFSKPISCSMLQVLKRYLQENPDDRKRFWEVEGTGGEGDRTLIWYNIKRLEKNKQQ